MKASTGVDRKMNLLKVFSRNTWHEESGGLFQRLSFVLSLKSKRYVKGWEFERVKDLSFKVKTAFSSIKLNQVESNEALHLTRNVRSCHVGTQSVNDATFARRWTCFINISSWKSWKTGKKLPVDMDQANIFFM